MKKTEFNKIIVAASVIIAIGCTVWAIVRDALGHDIGSLIAIIGIVWVEVTGVTGTYAAKTKALNKIKLIGSLPEELRSQVDLNQIINN
ncbi:MAG: hypothetical protein NC223_00875 [Butyrivibrio sp.]|nr:hypothetical protein [Butyrivibrio sp.]